MIGAFFDIERKIHWRCRRMNIFYDSSCIHNNCGIVDNDDSSAWEAEGENRKEYSANDIEDRTAVFG